MDEVRKFLKKKSNKDENTHYHYAFSQIMVNKLIKDNNSMNILGKTTLKTAKKQDFDIILNSNSMLCHIFQSKILRGTSPDFCIVDLTRAVNSFSIIAPIEIKKTGCINDYAKGQLFSYCEHILITQSKRSFVIGALTDCSSEIVFLKMTRHSDFNGQFSACISSSFSLNQTGCHEGYLYLIAFLNGTIDCGYESPPQIMFKSMNIKYLKYLSSGLTASVYKGEFMNKKSDQSFVVNQFNKEVYFNQEFEIMKLISNCKNEKAKEFVINLIGEATLRLDNQAANCMLLEPFCESAENETLTEMKLDEYFDCLKAISQFKIVHRDISNRHFMRNSKTKRLVIIDFGFACKYGEYISYSGSTTYAPNQILSGVNGHMYKPIFMHDLESLAKMIFINSFYSHYSAILSKINRDFAELLDFWNHIEISLFQKNEIILTKVFESIKLDINIEKYEQHCDEVKNLIKNSSLCCLKDKHVKLFENLNLDNNE